MTEQEEMWEKLKTIPSNWKDTLTWLPPVKHEIDLIKYSQAEAGDVSMVTSSGTLYLFLNKEWKKIAG